MAKSNLERGDDVVDGLPLGVWGEVVRMMAGIMLLARLRNEGGNYLTAGGWRDVGLKVRQWRVIGFIVCAVARA